MQGWLSHLANAGLRDYAHFGKPSPPNVQYILPMYPGNTPNSWRRQLYLLRQTILLTLSPFRSTDLFGGAGTWTSAMASRQSTSGR